MAKGMDSKKAAKKKPAKTADEKRADKKAKKTETGLFGHRVPDYRSELARSYTVSIHTDIPPHVPLQYLFINTG